MIRVSALKALEGDPEWVAKVEELMEAVDTYIPDPVRETDKPFLMPIEDVFTITGRGTVVTGRAERGTLKINSEVEIVGFRYDINLLVFRFDIGYALHFPYDTGRNGYFNAPNFRDAFGVHLALGYPF